MNVLVIAPHPDDESIGCGGTICRHADRGDRVAGVFLTSGELGLQGLPTEKAQDIREREAEKAAGILGIASLSFMRRPDGHLSECVEQAVAAIAPVLAREAPSLIYLPHEHDWHPDHRASVAIVQAALNAQAFPRPILRSYEVLTPLQEYDYVEDISAVLLRKLEAVRAHRSQVRQLRYDVTARALSESRGTAAQAGRHAEVFRLTDGVQGIDEVRRADPAWHRAYHAAEQIVGLVPERDALIVVDDGHWDIGSLVAPRKCIPFLEKDGRYWGRPPDDATAIQEIERLRKAGARFMVFAATAMWWLDHYATMHQYLRTQFRCVLEDAQLAIFELREGGNLRRGL